MASEEKRYFYITPQDYKVASELGISKFTLDSRVKVAGWDVDKAISKPVKKYANKGRWAKWKYKSVVPYGTFVSRIRNGMSEKDAALTPFIGHKARQAKEIAFTEEELKKALSIGVDRKTVLQRYKSCKWTKEECISIPRLNRKDAAKYGIERNKKCKAL